MKKWISKNLFVLVLFGAVIVSGLLATTLGFKDINPEWKTYSGWELFCSHVFGFIAGVITLTLAFLMGGISGLVVAVPIMLLLFCLHLFITRLLFGSIRIIGRTDHWRQRINAWDKWLCRTVESDEAIVPLAIIVCSALFMSVFMGMAVWSSVPRECGRVMTEHAKTNLCQKSASPNDVAMTGMSDMHRLWSANKGLVL